jgi:fatty-acid desaturase
LAHKDGKPLDVPFMNIIAPGEGWHKYHHNHPMAHRLNKFDIAGWTIERVFIKSKPSS